MAVGTVTVTAKAGPNITNTSVVFPLTNSVLFDLAREVLTLNVNGTIKDFDFNSVGTITFTVAASGGNATIAVS